MPAKKGGPDNPPFAYCRGAVAFVTAFLHPFFRAGPGSYRKIEEGWTARKHRTGQKQDREGNGCFGRRYNRIPAASFQRDAAA